MTQLLQSKARLMKASIAHAFSPLFLPVLSLLGNYVNVPKVLQFKNNSRGALPLTIYVLPNMNFAVLLVKFHQVFWCLFPQLICILLKSWTTIFIVHWITKFLFSSKNLVNMTPTLSSKSLIYKNTEGSSTNKYSTSLSQVSILEKQPSSDTLCLLLLSHLCIQFVVSGILIWIILPVGYCQRFC